MTIQIRSAVISILHVSRYAMITVLLILRAFDHLRIRPLLACDLLFAFSFVRVLLCLIGLTKATEVLWAKC